ncbi:hypothetical protein V494_04556 [Pseudogymnoascus sp. VKM F-4513 (FW-928)]|nr:hypothetical protein V494_04556 [Pseudogymnoascus sp. VKM F-4513 (FW-928)]
MATPSTPIAGHSSLDTFTADILVALNSPATSQSSLTITRAFTLLLRAHALESHLRITLPHEHDSQQTLGNQATCTDISTNGAEAVEMVPVAWAVKGGVIIPVEYFPGLGRKKEVTFGEAFVREFVSVVGECGLEGVVGLRLLQ